MIEQLSPTTYKFRLLSGDDAEIGDIRQGKFMPHLNLKRWGNECSLGLGLQLAGRTQLRIRDKAVEFEGEDTLLRWYELAPRLIENSLQNELGGVEFEIVLLKRPATNSIVLPIETAGLKYYYQPPLTPGEIAGGAFCPENVVGSYAVYHATRGNMHGSQADAEKYRCGKAFHIYRPKVTDNAGKETWAILNIDGGLLTITIDPSWLAGAVYPVTIDPNFGYDTLGASTLAGWSTQAHYSYSPSENGTLDSMSFGLLNTETPTDFSMAIYIAASGGSLIDYTYATASLSVGWNTLNAQLGAAVSAAQSYILCWTETGGQTISWSYDTVGGSGKYRGYDLTDYSVGNWPATEPSLYGDNFNADDQFSIYCTYTAGAAVGVGAFYMPFNPLGVNIQSAGQG